MRSSVVALVGRKQASQRLMWTVIFQGKEADDISTQPCSPPIPEHLAR